ELDGAAEMLQGAIRRDFVVGLRRRREQVMVAGVRRLPADGGREMAAGLGELARIQANLAQPLPHLFPPLWRRAANVGEPLEYARRFVDKARLMQFPAVTEKVIEQVERRAHGCLHAFLASLAPRPGGHDVAAGL